MTTSDSCVTLAKKTNDYTNERNKTMNYKKTNQNWKSTTGRRLCGSACSFIGIGIILQFLGGIVVTISPMAGKDGFILALLGVALIVTALALFLFALLNVIKTIGFNADNTRDIVTLMTGGQN